MIYNILKSSFLDMWPSIVLVCIVFITVRFAYFRNHGDTFRFHHDFWMLLGAVYFMILYKLLTKVDLNVYHGFNLVPLREILRYDYGTAGFTHNIIGNIVIFIPFGFIIAEYIKPKTIFPNLIIAIITSTTVEIIQYYIGRCFDIDDIILNTIGCIIGFLLYIGGRAIENHLPKFLTSDGFKNLICFILIIIGLYYMLRIMGIVG